MKKYGIRWLLFLLLSVTFSSRAKAQSTIFNIPTTDTVAKGKLYAEFDFLPQLPGTGSSRVYLYNPRVLVGVPGDIEFGVNFPTFNTKTSTGSSTNGYIQPNAKWKFYKKESIGLGMAVGGLLNMPLNHRSEQDSWGMLYGLVCKKIKSSNYGPRFHGGLYGIVSANQDTDKGPVSFSGPRLGAILGYEQPVHKRISVVADWLSGKNSYGYFTPGISIGLPGSGLLNIGYSIGNDSWADGNATKNRYVFICYGITF